MRNLDGARSASDTSKHLYDPLVDAADRGIAVRIAPLESTRSVWIPHANTIAIADALDTADGLYSVAHQLQHVTAEAMGGYNPADRARTESLVISATARRMAESHVLLPALRRSDDAEQVAEDLRVPLHVLATRITELTPIERTSYGMFVTRLFWPEQAYARVVLQCGRFGEAPSARAGSAEDSALSGAQA